MNNRQIQQLLTAEYLSDIDIDDDIDETKYYHNSFEPEIIFEKSKTTSKRRTKKYGMDFPKSNTNNHVKIGDKLCSLNAQTITDQKLDKAICHCLTMRRLTLLNKTDSEIIVSCVNDKTFCFDIQDFLNGATCDCVSCEIARKRRLTNLAKRASQLKVKFLANEYIEGISTYPVLCTNNVTHILTHQEFYDTSISSFDCPCGTKNHKKSEPKNTNNTNGTNTTPLFYIPPSHCPSYDYVEKVFDKQILYSTTNPYPENLHYTYFFLKRLLVRTNLPTIQILDNIDYRTLHDMYSILKQSCYNEVTINIDHVIPVSFFDLNSISHVRACWNIENLRFMTHVENTTKGNGIRHIDLEYIHNSKYLTFVFYNLLGLN